MDTDINGILETIFKVLKSTYKEYVEILNDLMRSERYEDSNPTLYSRFISYTLNKYIVLLYYHKSQGHIAYVIGDRAVHSCTESGKWADAIVSTAFLKWPVNLLTNLLLHFEFACNLAHHNIKRFNRVCNPTIQSDTNIIDNEIDINDIIINDSDLIDAVYFNKDGNIYDDSKKKKNHFELPYWYWYQRLSKRHNRTI